jgi:hypothetical protein
MCGMCKPGTFRLGGGWCAGACFDVLCMASSAAAWLGCSRAAELLLHTEPMLTAAMVQGAVLWGAGADGGAGVCVAASIHGAKQWRFSSS